jgi:hypothetical protein
LKSQSRTSKLFEGGDDYSFDRDSEDDVSRDQNINE